MLQQKFGAFSFWFPWRNSYEPDITLTLETDSSQSFRSPSLQLHSLLLDPILSAVQGLLVELIRDSEKRARI